MVRVARGPSRRSMVFSCITLFRGELAGLNAAIKIVSPAFLIDIMTPDDSNPDNSHFVADHGIGMFRLGVARPAPCFRI